MKVMLINSVQFENEEDNLEKGQILTVLKERGNTFYCHNPNWAGKKGFWISKNEVTVV